MKQKKGYSILELLMVIALLGAIIIPLLLSYGRTQANQGLRVTSEKLADDIRRAHIFARESKDQKNWGVVRQSGDEYSVVTGTPTSWTSIQDQKAEINVSFPVDFAVWFDVGTGSSSSEHTVLVENSYGKKFSVKVYKSGVVEVNSI